mgnify:CR=1 FL=1
MTIKASDVEMDEGRRQKKEIALEEHIIAVHTISEDRRRGEREEGR